jgi:hypothetical protein
MRDPARDLWIDPETIGLVQNLTVYHFVNQETRFFELGRANSFSAQTKSSLI